MQGQVKTYDVAIIGGGINGIGLFRDLAKHGVESILIEKGDFMSQTSGRSSKMLHGGIRYLENFDFPLIKEALHEKNLWVNLAPHLCVEKRFYVPVFDYSKFPLWLTYGGLKIYDFLSNFKNTPSTVVTKKKLELTFPHLTDKGLKGAAVYYDALMNDSRLGIECLLDALSNNCGKALNYTVLEKVVKEGSIFVLTLRKTRTDEVLTIKAKELVFTTGPFTDRLLDELNLFHWKPKLIASKGSHIWLAKDKFPIPYPVVLQTLDKRVLFALPQGETVLIGTTEEKISDKDIFNILTDEKEIQYILKNLNTYFPGLEIKQNDIIGQFAGVRPLVKEEGAKAGQTSRQHKVYQPLPNAWVILGGKWTTFRTMVQDIARPLVNKYNPPYNHNKCIAKLNTTSPFESFGVLTKDQDILEKVKTSEYSECKEDFIERRLGQMYRGAISNKND